MKRVLRTIPVLLFACAAIAPFLPWTDFRMFSVSLWEYACNATPFQYEMYGRIRLVSPFGMLYLFFLMPFVSLTGLVMTLRNPHSRYVTVLSILPLVFTLGFIGAFIGVNKIPVFINTIDRGMIFSVIVSSALAVWGVSRKFHAFYNT